MTKLGQWTLAVIESEQMKGAAFETLNEMPGGIVGLKVEQRFFEQFKKVGCGRVGFDQSAE